MIQLKEYQHRVLGSVRDFLAECARIREPGSGFERVSAGVFGWSVPDWLRVRISGTAAGTGEDAIGMTFRQRVI